MLRSILASAVLLSSAVTALDLPYVPVPQEIYEAEGVTPPSDTALLAAVPSGGAFDRTGWVYTADSEQAGQGRYNAMDGNSNTIWHSMYSPTIHYLPHTMTIDMKVQKYVDGITYRPRQDNIKNGNIGQHKIYTSTDCVNFGNPVAYGTWFDDQTSKSAAFEVHPARCVRIVAVTEAGNRGPWSSASEFFVYGQGTYTKPNPALGLWGPTINFPLVPTAAAVEPDSGNFMTWSSYTSATFSGGPGGKTLTSIWNPTTKLVSERLVTNTQHDMFCPGISFDTTGRVFITGGNSAAKTSIYIGGSDTW
jgi:galactose oxidase